MTTAPFRPVVQAVVDYRAKMEIEAPIEMIDWTGAWWQKAT